MNKNSPNLIDYEEKNSRLSFLHELLMEKHFSPSSPMLSFSRNREERRAWELIKAGDLLYTIPSVSPLKSYCLKVKNKSLDCNSKNGHPYQIGVDCIAEKTHSALNRELFFSRFIISYQSSSIFKKYFEEAELIDGITEHNYQKGPLFTYNSITVNLAQDLKDLQYITEIASLHPFGERTALITLIARKNGRRCGALLAELSIDTIRSHKSQWRVFGSEYLWIKERAVTILRIYTAPKQWKIQKALIGCLLMIAPYIVEDELSVVDGISYDYHPLSNHFGFNIVVPHRKEESFYFWKPFTIPSGINYRGYQDDMIREKIKKIISDRKKSKYYIVSAHSSKIPIALDKKAWAIRRKFVGKWQTLRSGDVVFFVDENHVVVAYGYVDKIIQKKVRGLEMYPLWIEFTSGIKSKIHYDLKSHVNEKWYKRDVAGAISILPNEFGADIKISIDNQIKEGKMWVEPNPYLLKERSFVENHKQVFVVLAWSLKDTILPVIRDILEPQGYKVIFAGDRGGQVVFEDIWLMLNESQIVITDFTHKRPNVYLEYGMALVLGKPIVAITQDPKDIPSDTPNLKYIVYEDKMGDRNLHVHLLKTIENTVEDIERARKNS